MLTPLPDELASLHTQSTQAGSDLAADETAGAVVETEPSVQASVHVGLAAIEVAWAVETEPCVNPSLSCSRAFLDFSAKNPME